MALPVLPALVAPRLPVAPGVFDLIPTLALVVPEIGESGLILLLPIIPSLMAVINPLLPLGIPVLASFGPVWALLGSFERPLSFARTQRFSRPLANLRTVCR